MNAITKEESTALTLPERAAVALGAAEHEIKLRELVKSSADIVAVIDPAGREQAHRIGMTLKNARVSIEKTGKAAREDATAFSKAVIAEEKRLVGLITPEEDRVLGLRDTFDAAEQARKDALIAAERARVEAIQGRIEAIRRAPLAVVGESSAAILVTLELVRDTIIDDSFGELKDQAMAARSEAFNALEAAHDKAKEAEAAALAAEEARKAEAARIEAERAELAKQRAENERIANEQAAERQRLAAAQAAQEAAAAELRAKAEANLRAEREAQETAMRIQREAAAKAQQEAEAEITRARNELAAQQAAHAAAVKLEAGHAEALVDNAQFDIDRAQAMIDQARADAEAMPASVAELMESSAAHDQSLAAYADAFPDDLEVTDKEIMAIAAELGITPDAWVERLVAFCERMTSVTATGQRYSRTTFKDNGAAIFLNEDGSRSIFCDLDD